MSRAIFAAISLAVAFALWDMRTPSMNDYNRRVCAVYGYQNDCKKPLSESDQLK